MRIAGFFTYATILLLALAAAIVMAGGPGRLWARIAGDAPEEPPAETRQPALRGFGGDAGAQGERMIRDIEAMDELSRSVGR